jgi:hypothetical protein
MSQPLLEELPALRPVSSGTGHGRTAETTCHGSVNAGFAFAPTTALPTAVAFLGLGVAAILVAVMPRGRLGYQSNRRLRIPAARAADELLAGSPHARPRDQRLGRCSSPPARRELDRKVAFRPALCTLVSPIEHGKGTIIDFLYPA